MQRVCSVRNPFPVKLPDAQDGSYCLRCQPSEPLKGFRLFFSAWTRFFASRQDSGKRPVLVGAPDAFASCGFCSTVECASFSVLCSTAASVVVMAAWWWCGSDGVMVLRGEVTRLRRCGTFFDVFTRECVKDEEWSQNRIYESTSWSWTWTCGGDCKWWIVCPKSFSEEKS